MNKKYNGSCHCGSVEFTVKTDLESALRCNCSLCKRKGAVMLASEESDFEFIKGADNLSKYQFNTKVAEHYFCKKCGIYTHHKPRSNPKMIRVNAGCLEGVNSLDLEAGLNDGASFSTIKS